MFPSTEKLIKKRQELQDNYLSDDFDVEEWLKGRREMEDIVNNCRFETPEEVANHFIAYTAILWDYKMLGRIHECYHGNVVIHREDGADLVCTESIILDSLQLQAACSDLRIVFHNIFCERYDGPGGGYRFGQYVTYEGTNDGWSQYGSPTFRKLARENCLACCECLVQFTDGRWRISEEWELHSEACFDSVFRNK